MSKDAYYHVDKLREQCEAISDARADWQEQATINLLRRWTAELEREGSIEDLGYWEHDDIIAYCVDRSLPYDKGLFDLAYKFVEDSDLHGEISWS